MMSNGDRDYNSELLGDITKANFELPKTKEELRKERWEKRWQESLAEKKEGERLEAVAFAIDTIAELMPEEISKNKQALLDLANRHEKTTIARLKRSKSLSDIEFYLQRLEAIAEIQQHYAPKRGDKNKEIVATTWKRLTAYYRNNPGVARDILTKRIGGLDKDMAKESGFSDSEIKYLNALQLASDQNLAFDQSFNGKTREFHFIFGGRKWNLGFYRDLLVITADDNHEVFLTITKADALEAAETDRFTSLVIQAESNYASEENGEAQARAFDLPSDRPIRYFAVMPDRFNDMTATSRSEMALTQAALENNYGGNLDGELIKDDDPLVALYDRIWLEYENGVRDFYLDFYAHGNREGLGFGYMLNGSHLVDLVETFPEANFTISTLACHGAGLATGFGSALRSKADLAKRVTVLTQTKEAVSNYPASGTDEIGDYNLYASYYQLFFMEALQKGETLGSAAYYADKMTKRYIPMDAEMILDGRLISDAQSEVGIDQAAT